MLKLETGLLIPVTWVSIGSILELAGEVMDNSFIEQAVKLLVGARASHQRLETLPVECRPETIEDSYQVQDALINRLGLQVGGWKVGATSVKAQTMLGTNEPFAGRMFKASILDSAGELSMADLFTPGVEVEVAFCLGHDLPAGPVYARDEVADAVRSLHPAIEVVDTRYTSGLKAGIFQIVADNSAHAGFVVGSGIADWRGIDRQGIAVKLVINGEMISTGVGANAFGDPLDSLVWLANDRSRRGDGLVSGDFVTTGSCCDELGWAKAGDIAIAQFDTLGLVEARFT